MAVRGADGSAAWLTCEPIPNSEHLRQQPTAGNLYSGAAGIGVFLGALAALTGADRWRDLALGALQPLCSESPPADLGKSIGGVAGVSSAIYALSLVHGWLAEPTLASAARRLGQALSAERIQQDDVLDVVGGSAGAVLALLAAADGLGQPVLLDAAELCGEHLLRAQREDGGWTTVDTSPLCGLSHGASGAALALGRLGARLGDRRFLAAARRALQFERDRYDASVQDWPDLRSRSARDDGAPAFMTSWCHGAPGIGIARAGLLRVLEDPRVEAELRLAAERTLAVGPGGLDHLCCGAMGRVEALRVAGEALGRQDWLDRAADWTAGLAAKSSYRCLPGTHRIVQPGFFNGVAGVGYGLLRQLEPGLPSVASFEAGRGR